MKVFKELIPSLLKTRELRRKGWRQLIENKEKVVPVIVSLTTFGDRLQKVDIAIRSILNQTYLPEKIMLNVHKSYQNQVPEKLKSLVSDFVELNWVEEDSPHIKLLPTLQQAPDKCIITVDDDVIYPRDLIEKLYLQHLNNPGHIIANHIRVIQRDRQGNLMPYKSWVFDGKSDNPKLYLALGFGGVLYPPAIFNSEVFDSEKYMQLCPKADDLWFKAMALRNEIEILPLQEKPASLYPIAGTQTISLKAENVVEDRNKTQWQALVDYYDLSLQD